MRDEKKMSDGTFRTYPLTAYVRRTDGVPTVAPTVQYDNDSLGKKNIIQPGNLCRGNIRNHPLQAKMKMKLCDGVCVIAHDGSRTRPIVTESIMTEHE